MTDDAYAICNTSDAEMGQISPGFSDSIRRSARSFLRIFCQGNAHSGNCTCSKCYPIPNTRSDRLSHGRRDAATGLDLYATSGRARALGYSNCNSNPNPNRSCIPNSGRNSNPGV